MAVVKKAMRHKDELGAGAAMRRKYIRKRQDIVDTIMAEFRRGTLRSGSGEHVTHAAQAVAIAHSEAEKHGA